MLLDRAITLALLLSQSAALAISSVHSAGNLVLFAKRRRRDFIALLYGFGPPAAVYI